MIEKLLLDIVQYFDYLKNQHSLFVTFHNNTIPLNDHMAALSPYNINSNPYCLYVKSDSDAWTHCIKRQTKVYDKCEQGDFEGTCYAGMGEYVFPITDNEVLGYINISGYCFDEDRSLSCLRRISEEYDLYYDTLLSTFMQTTTTMSPNACPHLHTLAAPLCHMFVLLNRELVAIYGTTTKNNSTLSNILSHAVVFLDRNYMFPVQVKDVAAACHCSTSQISHLFKKNMNCSVSDYINRLRIRDSKNLLSNTQLSIQQISELVGYSSSNYLSEIFRSETGVSPRQYRRQYNEVTGS